MELHEKVLNRISVDSNGCWIWPGAVDGRGYGFVLTSRKDGPRKHRIAHRVVYLALIGTIPEGHDLHHTCEVRRCVNPKHLKAIMHGEHQRQHGAEVCRVCGSDDWQWWSRTDRGGRPSRRCGECNRRNQRRYRNQ